jgi:hypothetical protein
MNSGPSIPFVRTLPHPWDTRSPALSRVRVKWKSVLLDPQPSLLTLRRRAFRLCSNDSSVLCRSVTPRRRACGPYGLSLRPPTCCPDWTAGVSEVSRFSCLKFLGVSGVFDYAGLSRDSRYRPYSCCLPRILKTSAPGLYVFGAQLPTPPIPLSTLRCVPHDTQCKTRGRVDRWSFLVRIFHSLLQAGLSRRTYIAIALKIPQ